MFCPECGTPLEAGSYKCLSCKWTCEDIEGSDVYFDDAEVPSNETNISNTKISKLGIFLVIAIIFVSIFGIAWITIYKNSDGYKVKQATILVASLSEYKIDEGLELIEDVDTPQARAIKEFANVQMAKVEFADHVFFEDVEFEDYIALKEKFDDFSASGNAELLTGELRENFDCYRVAFEYASDYTSASGEMAEALYNVQCVKLNDADINSGDWFTLNELQDRIDESLFAIGLLNDYDGYHITIDNPEVLSYCWIRSHIEGDKPGVYDVPAISLDRDLIGSLISECEQVINKSQRFVSEYSKTYRMSEEIRKPEPEEDTVSRNEVHYEMVQKVDDILTQIEMNIFYEITMIK